MRGVWIATLLCSVHSLHVPGDSKGKWVRVHVEQLPAEVVRIRRHIAEVESVESYPANLTFRVPVEGTYIVLNLKRSNINLANVPVYVHVNNTVLKKKNLHKKSIYSVYQDIKTKSSMLVTCRFEKCFLEGSFEHDHEMYRLKPSKKTEQQLEEHWLQKVETKEKNVHHDFVPPPLDVEKENQRSDDRREKRGITEELIVELLACPDDTIYKYFRSVERNSRAAEMAVQQYYALLINEMDLYYLSLSKLKYSAMTIRIYLTGIVIAKRASDCPWSTNNTHVTSSTTYLNGSAALWGLAKWRWKNLKAFDRHDYAIGFSRKEYEFLAPNGEATSKGLAGLAYLKVVCKSSAVGIVEDDGQRTSFIAAHEMAHGLGSNHDGRKGTISAECPRELSNVMSSTFSSTVKSQTKGNAQWQFSECSSISFQNFINSLKFNCLAQHNFHSIHYKALRAQPHAGQMYNLDQQCRFSLGPWALSCTKSVKELDCYYGIRCRFSSSAPCSAKRYYLFAGTPCGTPGGNKWCHRGECKAIPADIAERTTATATQPLPTTTPTTRPATTPSTTTPTTTPTTPTPTTILTTTTPTTTSTTTASTTISTTTPTALLTTLTSRKTTPPPTTITSTPAPAPTTQQIETTIQSTTSVQPTTSQLPSTDPETTNPGITNSDQTTTPAITTVTPTQNTKPTTGATPKEKKKKKRCFKGYCCMKQTKPTDIRLCCYGEMCCNFSWAVKTVCCRSCRSKNK